MFVVTLDVAVGTQLKQPCLWIYTQHVYLDTQMIVSVEFVTVSHSYLPSQSIRAKFSSVNKIFGILLINKNTILNMKF